MTRSPAALLVGGLSVVLPTDDRRLTRGQMADLSCAVLLDAGGLPDAANDIVARLERKLGVNEAHRNAVVWGSEEWTRRNREAKRRSKLAAVEMATRPPLRDPEILGKLADLQTRLTRAHTEAEKLRADDPKKHRKRIKAFDAMARGIEQQMAKLELAEKEQERLCGEAYESILWAKARGEGVEAREVEVANVQTDEHGVRLLHKDGEMAGLPRLEYSKVSRVVLQDRGGSLEWCLAKGHLDPVRGPITEDALYAAGKAYQEAYEIEAGVRTADKCGPGGFGPKGPQIKIVEAGELLAAMRAPLTDRERKVLDEVCGQDKRPRQVADEMHAGFPSIIRALRSGLEKAGDAHGAAWGKAADTAARLRGAHRLLEAVA